VAEYQDMGFQVETLLSDRYNPCLGETTKKALLEVEY
jgi:hypothetical protein